MSITDNDAGEVLRGLAAAKSFLKNTVTQVDKNGVMVKISAEPKILELRIDQSNDILNLEKCLLENINEALDQNRNKVVENALKELP